MFRGIPELTVQADSLVAYVSCRHGEFVILAVFDTDCEYTGVEKFVNDLNGKLDGIKVLGGRAKSFVGYDWIKAYTLDRGIELLGTDMYKRLVGLLNAMKGKREYPRFEIPLASKM